MAVLLAAGFASVCIAVGSTYSPQIMVGLAIAATLAAITVANLMYGVIIFTLVTFFERLPGLEGLALSKPMGLVLLVSWLVTLAQGSRETPSLVRDRPTLAYILILFVGWATVSALWAVDSHLALANAIRLALIVVLIFILFSALRTPRDLRLLVWSFLIGAASVGVVSLLTGSNKAGRIALGELDPNFLGTTMAASFMLAVFLLCATPSRFVRVTLMGMMALFFVAIILTESRGGVVALACACIVAPFLAGSLRARVIALILVLAAFGLAYFTVLAPSAARTRIESISTGQETHGRLNTWRIALHAAADHPVQGVGLANFRVVEINYLTDRVNLPFARRLHEGRLVAHNTYLELLSELGIVGLALLAAATLATIIPAARSAAAMALRAPRSEPAARGLLVAMIALLVGYFFLSALYAKHLWLLFGALAALPTIAMRAEPDASHSVDFRRDPSPGGATTAGAPVDTRLS